MLPCDDSNSQFPVTARSGDGVSGFVVESVILLRPHLPKRFPGLLSITVEHSRLRLEVKVVCETLRGHGEGVFGMRYVERLR